MPLVHLTATAIMLLANVTVKKTLIAVDEHVINVLSTAITLQADVAVPFATAMHMDQIRSSVSK